MSFVPGMTGPIAAAAQAVAASIVFTEFDKNAGGAAAAIYTFTGKAIGVADASRQVIVGVMTESGLAISSVTVGGVTATLVKHAQNAGANDAADLYIAAVPAGATGTVVVTYSVSAARQVAIALWAMYGCSATPTDTGSDIDSNPATYDIDVIAGGAAVACVNHRSNTDLTYSWAGLTESFDQVVLSGSNCGSGGAQFFAAAQTNLTVSATASGAGFRTPILVAASFPPL